MNEPQPSFWYKAWNEPRRFFAWLTLFSLVGVAVGYVLFANTNFAFQTQPSWAGKLLLFGTAICLAGFILSFICYVLAWIPPLRRLLTWLLRRRFYVLACLVTLVTLFYTEENWRGKRAWENYKREQEARGEYLDIARLIPPPVPDDQNFALTPLLKPALDFQRTDKGVVWNDHKALARLRRIGQDSLPLRKDDTKIYPNLGDLFKGTLADLDTWSAYFKDNTNFPQAAVSASRAEKILYALDTYQPELDELKKTATTRPLSRFPIDYNYEPAWAILLPHLADMKGLTRLVCVRSIARLDAGQADGAYADLNLAFRLSDSIKDEPLLIDHLVRLGILNYSLESLREGLARHAWSDAQLTDMESRLAAINLLTELKQALRGERAFGVSCLDWLRRQGFKARLGDVFYGQDNGGDKAAEAIKLLPNSFYYFNMLTVARTEEPLFLAFDDSVRRVFPEKIGLEEEAVNALTAKAFHPYSIFARILVPALGKSTIQSARIQTYVDLARVACALERHRIAYGNYPNSLASLEPGLIAQLPHDLINGEPLHYQHEGEGYILYSVGWNEEDDGGTIAFRKDSSVDPDQGDWVWRVPAK